MKGIFLKCFSSPDKFCKTVNTAKPSVLAECGMRNPSTRHRDDDLSRLTTSSTSSRDQNNANYPILVDSDNNSAEFTSTYLPQVIDPHEWQQQKLSRKRKERQDSTSSITQDRKLVRSNSEEYLSNIDCEVIRRVSSNEEIKNSVNDSEKQQQEKENENPLVKQSYHHSDDVSSIKSANNEVQEILRETHRRTETSPARSRTFDFSHKLRISPNRDAINYGRGGGSCSTGRDDDEPEQRRTSERFCKARAAQSSRKSVSSKKSTPQSLPRQSSSTDSETKLRERTDNTYKYDDMSAMKSERRGFMSSKHAVDRHQTAEMETAKALLNSSGEADDDNYDDDYDDISSSFSDHNDNNIYAELKETAKTTSPAQLNKSPKLKPKHESLPWDYSQEDDQPVISQRFADNKFDHVNNSRDIDMKVRNASVTKPISIPHFAKSENLKTRDIIKTNALPNVYVSPDEKIKQISKRLTALKKRVTLFEENFELENGYRPSHSMKLNDRYIKNALAEIHKLRKEKQALKSDPMAAMCYKITQPGGENKVQKMKDTILEIEKRLQTKRSEENRTNVVDEMSADQLVQEKSAMQRALLYLESLYGRPNTREERDAARLLYDRYRVIKRLVNRSVSISGAGINSLSELPTILEHEAMAFTVAAISLTPPPFDTETLNIVTVDSPTDPSSLMSSTDSTDTSSSINENVHDMSLEELSRNCDIVRDEKKKLRRTIKDFEEVFEEQNGRKMLKSDRSVIEDTYALYKQKKAKLRLLDALVRKKMTK